MTGRAFLDYRLDQTRNVFGEIKETVLDPFAGSGMLPRAAERFGMVATGFEKALGLDGTGEET